MITEIAQAWPQILLAWAAFSLLVFSPGPTLMAIMGTSMARGRRAGVVFTTGCMTGSTIWGAMANLGLSLVLAYFAQALVVLKILGGLYLLWMAVKAFRSAWSIDAQTVESQAISARKLYFSGLALHLTNPKVMLGWGTMATIAQQHMTSFNVLLATYAGGLCITYSVHYCYACLFASRPAIALYAKARRAIHLVLGGVFSYAGVRLMVDDLGLPQ